jgi:hypothetical protein
MLAGTAIDLVVDGLMIGIGFAAGAKEGRLLAIALGVELISLGLAVASSMSKLGVPARRSLYVLAALSVIWGLAYGVRTHVWVSAQTDQSWGQARVAEEAITRRWQAATDFVVTDDAPESAVKLVKLGRSGAIGTGRWNDICTQGDYRKRNLYFVLDPATYFREINAGLFCLSTPGTEILSGGGETSREWMVVRVPGWS